MNFCIHFVYFTNYYNLLLYEFSNLSRYQVCLLIFQHLLSESFQSILRFSTVYFDQTKDFYAKMERHSRHRRDDNNDNDYNDCNDTNFNSNSNPNSQNKLISNQILLILLNIFKDDSNINELIQQLVVLRCV